MSIATDLARFYGILRTLEARLGGRRRLIDCHGRMGWPSRGVYFFFEGGERRSTGSDGRVVRVGTHAVAKAKGAGTKLWTRLKQHRGTGDVGAVGRGNHRESVFRRHVGGALIDSGRPPALASWGAGNSAPAGVRKAERDHERAVSSIIARMPFLWIAAADEPSPESVRAFIERNAIGLLCRARQEGIDQPSVAWLGRHARASEIRESGLWNVDHVGRDYAPAFLDAFERLARETPTLLRG